ATETATSEPQACRRRRRPLPHVSTTAAIRLEPYGGTRTRSSGKGPPRWPPRRKRGKRIQLESGTMSEPRCDRHLPLACSLGWPRSLWRRSWCTESGRAYRDRQGGTAAARRDRVGQEAAAARARQSRFTPAARQGEGCA